MGMLTHGEADAEQDGAFGLRRGFPHGRGCDVEHVEDTATVENDGRGSTRLAQG